MAEQEQSGWQFNAESRDIEFNGCPVFNVYGESDFPCIEDEDRPEAETFYDDQAQTAVLLLNGVMHDAPSPDAVNADKAVASTLETQVVVWENEWLRCPNDHWGDSVDWSTAKVIAQRLDAATPAPDKALMPDAAAILAEFRSGFTADHLDRIFGPDMKQRIDRVVLAFTTPTPVEEPEKGAAGEVDSVLQAINGGGPHEWGYRDLTTGEFIADSWPFHAADVLRALAATNAGQVEAWKPIESAPYAMHVLAARFDDEAGEWIVHVAMSPPSKPFTHWCVLPALPDGSGPVTALKANGDAS